MIRVRYAWCLVACAALGLEGCRHRARIALAPPPPPVPTISVPPPTHRTEPFAAFEYESVPPLTVLLPRRPLPRFRPRPTTARQLALLLPPAPLPPVELGELTTGGEASEGSARQQTLALLRAQKQRLAVLGRSAGGPANQQVRQAALFLQQADEAWRNLDADGARTLATKAKVLLDEIE